MDFGSCNNGFQLDLIGFSIRLFSVLTKLPVSFYRALSIIDHSYMVGL